MKSSFSNQLFLNCTSFPFNHIFLYIFFLHHLQLFSSLIDEQLQKSLVWVSSIHYLIPNQLSFNSIHQLPSSYLLLFCVNLLFHAFDALFQSLLSSLYSVESFTIFYPSMSYALILMLILSPLVLYAPNYDIVLSFVNFLLLSLLTHLLVYLSQFNAPIIIFSTLILILTVSMPSHSSVIQLLWTFYLQLLLYVYLLYLSFILIL